MKLKDEKYRLQIEDANREGARLKLADLDSLLSEKCKVVHEYGDAQVRLLAQIITVHDDSLM